MLHCWQDKPAERPTFTEIQEKLNDLYELPGRDNTSQYYLKVLLYYSFKMNFHIIFVIMIGKNSKIWQKICSFIVQ